MTPDPQERVAYWPRKDGAPASRLELKPEGPTTGSVDGAWWPRSRALPTELSALVERLGVGYGHIARLTYYRGTWDPAPRRVVSPSGRTSLDGFPRATDPHTVTLVGANGRRTTLLVVPPDADESVARRILTTASTAGNRDTTASLLAGVDVSP